MRRADRIFLALSLVWRLCILAIAALLVVFVWAHVIGVLR